MRLASVPPADINASSVKFRHSERHATSVCNHFPPVAWEQNLQTSNTCFFQEILTSSCNLVQVTKTVQNGGCTCTTTTVPRKGKFQFQETFTCFPSPAHEGRIAILKKFPPLSFHRTIKIPCARPSYVVVVVVQFFFLEFAQLGQNGINLQTEPD